MWALACRGTPPPRFEHAHRFKGFFGTLPLASEFCEICTSTDAHLKRLHLKTGVSLVKHIGSTSQMEFLGRPTQRCMLCWFGSKPNWVLGHPEQCGILRSFGRKPNWVAWMSRATQYATFIWMQAKLSWLDVQSNVVCYVHLDASQIELFGRPEQHSMLRSYGQKPNWVALLWMQTKLSSFFSYLFVSSCFFFFLLVSSRFFLFLLSFSQFFLVFLVSSFFPFLLVSSRFFSVLHSSSCFFLFFPRFFLFLFTSSCFFLVSSCSRRRAEPGFQ